MIYSFKGYIPVIHESSFVHPLAAVTGNVIIGKHCYIGPGAAIRGDWGQIILEDGVNVQENCTVHMFPGKSITLKESAHIGHGAIIHGANIGKNVLVGMNTVIMDDAEIGDEIFGHDAAQRVGDDTVDVLGAESRVFNGTQRGFESEGLLAFVRVFRVAGLADAGDRCFVAEFQGS